MGEVELKLTSLPLEEISIVFHKNSPSAHVVMKEQVSTRLLSIDLIVGGVFIVTPCSYVYLTSVLKCISLFYLFSDKSYEY